MSIDKLLEETPSEDIGKQVDMWIEDILGKITRGDLMIGILSLDEVKKIPDAYRKSFECGNKEALADLALWYTYPRIGEPDLDEADRLYRRLAVKDEYYLIELAKFRWFNRRDIASEEEKLEIWELLYEAAEKGSDEACYLLGLFAAEGFGTKQCLKTALTLFERASEYDNADALFELYVYYSKGIGVEQDSKRAFSYNKKAAALHHHRALYNMGTFYAAGKHVKKNIKEAVSWYERASDYGNPQAALTLGIMYAEGVEVQKDLDKASDYFDDASYNGIDYDIVSEYCDKYGIEY